MRQREAETAKLLAARQQQQRAERMAKQRKDAKAKDSKVSKAKNATANQLDTSNESSSFHGERGGGALVSEEHVNMLSNSLPRVHVANNGGDDGAADSHSAVCFGEGHSADEIARRSMGGGTSEWHGGGGGAARRRSLAEKVVDLVSGRGRAVADDKPGSNAKGATKGERLARWGGGADGGTGEGAPRRSFAGRMSGLVLGRRNSRADHKVEL